MTKKKIKAEGPTVSESYKNDLGIITGISWRMKAKCIDAPSYVRGIPKTLLPYDSFLAYIEWKASKPFYERWFLP